MSFTGLSEDKKLVEIIENEDHPWFIAAQFHPEFTSTPSDGHPLFEGFVAAAHIHQKASCNINRPCILHGLFVLNDNQISLN